MSFWITTFSPRSLTPEPCGAISLCGGIFDAVSRPEPAGYRNLCIGIWTGSACPATDAFNGQNPALPLIHIDNGVNSAHAQAQHYVVLVSLDGFRWDYAQRDGAIHLLALGKQGVWAPKGMLPSYPSLTFPNHYTIVTGLYPEHHGLVANSFYDEARQARYAMSDANAVRDGTWYSGTPLWSLAESQGMRTASLFWVGSEAKIAGFRPTWYAQFDSKIETTTLRSRRGSTMPLPC